MTQHAMNYAKALFDKNISNECIEHTKEMISSSSELLEALSNPAVKKVEKHNVIDKLFDQEIRGFLKVLCDYNAIGILNQILKSYDDYVLASKNIVKATLTYVIKPDDNQIEQIKEMVCKKYNKTSVLLELKEDSSLLGGFILTVGNTQYDKSVKGTLANLQKTLVWR